jgi:hypothetical protein
MLKNDFVNLIEKLLDLQWCIPAPVVISNVKMETTKFTNKRKLYFRSCSYC